jgi:glutamate synthase domain-containing protein 3
MTGGLAYVFDPGESLERFLNPDLVSAAELGSEGRHELADLLRRHARHTGSMAALEMLSSWPRAAAAFRAVVPKPPKAAPGLPQRPIVALTRPIGG